jgi:hypothetical protein
LLNFFMLTLKKLNQIVYIYKSFRIFIQTFEYIIYAKLKLVFYSLFDFFNLKIKVI